MYKTVKNYKELPTSPGVYIFKDKDKKVLYVGKAINLLNRASSYFQNTNNLTPKTRALMEKVETINFVVVENELEALLVEAELIKRYKPPYNINLKDDKFYKYIKIEKDRITTSRKSENKNGVEYFGPYPDGQNITRILKFLRKVFPYRDCTNGKFSKYKKLGKPCLYGHIGLCPAPCIDNKVEGLNSTKQNQENIQRIKEYLRGDRKKVFRKLEKEMFEASKNQEYEKASILRDQLFSYEYLTQPTHLVGEYIEQPNFLEDQRLEGLKELIEILHKENLCNLTNDKIPQSKKEFKKYRIETYDISNFQGKYAVGSMVVTIGGFADKTKYRRFKIKSKNTPDDFKMMSEVLERRFNENNVKKWGIPDLIVIDGGKGQLSSVIDVLEYKQINIPVISLAKRFEEIIIPVCNNRVKNLNKTGGIYETVRLNKDSNALKIIIIGRDEAHRFAISYYRKLHRKGLIEN